MEQNSKLTVGTVQPLVGSKLKVKIPVTTEDPTPELGAGMLAYVNNSLRIYTGIRWQGIDEGILPITDGLITYLDASNATSYPRSGNIWFNLASNSNSIGDFNLTNFTFLPDAGGAFRFNNGSAISSNNYNAGSNGITMEVVMYNTVADTRSQFGRILDWNDSSMIHGSFANNQFRSWINAGGSRSNEFQINSTQANYYNRWNHAAITYNKSNVIGYWNSVDTVSSTSAKTGDLESTASPFTVGNGDSNAYYGLIGLVRIYNRALSGNEIIQNYNSLKTKYNLPAG